ncbi:MAG: hypothetical protein L0177_08815 [Chloroflexi bacterium]|nr:hypothetical protein [Chloroflexota bacterium]
MRSAISAAPVPGAVEKPLNTSLGNHMLPSASRVPPIYRETTICYSYMCSYAYGCSEKTARPAQVLMRRCMRYMPESLRVQPALSDLALDLLAKRRQSGEQLSSATNAILDEFRPEGPTRKSV